MRENGKMGKSEGCRLKLLMEDHCMVTVYADGVHGAARVDKIPANVNSRKIAIKGIERKKLWGAVNYIVQDITRN